MEKNGGKKRVKEIVFDENDNRSVESYRNKKGKKGISEVSFLLFLNSSLRKSVKVFLFMHIERKS